MVMIGRWQIETLRISTCSCKLLALSRPRPYDVESGDQPLPDNTSFLTVNFAKAVGDGDNMGEWLEFAYYMGSYMGVLCVLYGIMPS